MNIPLSNPDITQKEIKAVVEVLKTPNLSSGPKLVEFEEKFASYIGSKYAVAVNSGTSGLHLCIKALDIKDSDEVITSPFSFISSSNCIMFERAKPVFVDINRDTLNIDEESIEKKISKKTKALLPVHVFGYPCNMDKINKIAKKYKLSVIEDACEAIGAEMKGKKAGSFGTCSVFAFYPNKQMTTGEGGIVLTNNKRIARLCRSLRNQGRDEGAKWFMHNRLGYNYRLNDLSCVLGISQLERIEELLEKRERVAELYEKEFSDVEEIIAPPKDGSGIKRSWFVYVIQLRDKFSELQRNEIIRMLRLKGIGCSAYFSMIHLQPFYRKMYGYKKGHFPTAESIGKRTIALPFYGNLKEKDVKVVVKNFKEVLQEIKDGR